MRKHINIDVNASEFPRPCCAMYGFEGVVHMMVFTDDKDDIEWVTMPRRIFNRKAPRDYMFDIFMVAKKGIEDKADAQLLKEHQRAQYLTRTYQ